MRYRVQFSDRLMLLSNLKDLPAFHTRSKESLNNVAIDEFEQSLLRSDPDIGVDSFQQCSLDEDYVNFIAAIAKDSTGIYM